MATLTISQAYELAVQWHRSGRLAEAESVYRQILELQPSHADALHLLGVIAQQTGRLDQAFALIQRAIALKSGDAEYHNNLGEVLRLQAHLPEAVRCYENAIRLRPNFATALSNLGMVLMHQGRLAEAEHAIEEALRLEPNHVGARFNLGCIADLRGRPDEAIAAFQEVARLQPDFRDAHLNLGRIFLAAGKIEAAIDAYHTVLAANPSSSAACNNLGNAAKDQGDLDEALRWYRRALELAPGDIVVHSNLVYLALFHPGFDATDLQREHERWRERHAAALETRAPLHRRRPQPHSRLRIGYVSPSFSEHVVGWNLLPLFRHHDREEFEICCYSDVLQPDAVTAEFRTLADRWVDSRSWSHEQLAARIADDEIDILVDLTLHMAQHRLLTFACRPAPAQVTFAGYPGTTGLKSIQYRFTDEHLDPEALAGPYTETSLRLKSFWCFQPRGDEPEVGALPSATQAHITFGCLNNFCKVTPSTLRLWAKVLQVVPNSRLLLLAAAGNHRARTLEALRGEGIAAERIDFVPRKSHRDYMATYQQIDIALDTLPYNGHTTSCDALWMGVPVVTLVGSTVVGRAGLSQLTNVGLPELIARSPAEFVTLARNLAADAPRRAELRATLRSRMKASPLMDAPGFARAIESHYRSICASPGAE